MAIEIGPGISIGGGISFIPGGGGGLSPITGSFQVGQNVFASEIHGAAENPAPGMGNFNSITPSGIMNYLAYDSIANQTYFFLNRGTFGSYTVANTTINGSSLVNVNVGGTAQNLNIGDTGGNLTGVTISGDTFNLPARNGQTLVLTVTVL